MKDIIKLVANTYKSVRVVGRGTIVISPEEVMTSPEFKNARARIKSIFNKLPRREVSEKPNCRYQGGAEVRLSEKLERYRTGRPDEWTMDEFARQARLLEDALLDARSGLRYIKQSHGELYGVGFDRVETKAAVALAEVQGE